MYFILRIAIIFAVVLALAASQALALEMPTIDDQLEMMTLELDLTEEQRTAIRPLIEANRNTLAPLFQSLKQTRRKLAKFSIMKKIQKEQARFRDELATVLTDEQLEKYDHSAKARKETLRKRMQEG